MLDIDQWRLRFFLFGLEAKLGVSFPAATVERVFSDSVSDQVSAKRYVLFESDRLSVVGTVDEYEPETIWISLKNAPSGTDLEALWDAAGYHSLRARKALGNEDEREAEA